MPIFVRLTLLMLLVGAAWAGAETATTAWQPPEPTPESRDWVRLNSEEWLRGRIELLQDLKLSFDSDELDDLEIDWEDVAEIRSPRILTFGLLDGTVVTGTSVMKDGILEVRTTSGVEEFAAQQVFAIIEGRPRELNYWSLKASANLIVRSGNTEQNDFNSVVLLRRQTTWSQVNLQYKGNFGKTDGEETVNNNRGDIDAKLFLSRQLFVTPVDVELLNDKFQNIDLRSGVSAGFGYYFIRARTDWQINAAGGYQRTRYASVAAGEDDRIDNGTITLGTVLETDLTSAIEIDAEYSIRRTLGADRATLHRFFMLLSFDLLGDVLDFTTSIAWDYNTNPKQNAEGLTPRKSDLTMAYGLGVDF